MYFIPKNGKFSAVNMPEYEICPKDFTIIMYLRSKNAANSVEDRGGIDATNQLMGQIDATEPSAFSLLMMPIEEWHVHMIKMGYEIDLTTEQKFLHKQTKENQLH